MVAGKNLSNIFFRKKKIFKLINEFTFEVVFNVIGPIKKEKMWASLGVYYLGTAFYLMLRSS